MIYMTAAQAADMDLLDLEFSARVVIVSEARMAEILAGLV